MLLFVVSLFRCFVVSLFRFSSVLSFLFLQCVHIKRL